MKAARIALLALIAFAAAVVAQVPDVTGANIGPAEVPLFSEFPFFDQVPDVT